MCLTCSKTLSDDDRVNYAASIFSFDFSFRLEPVVFAFAERLSRDYTGGLWEFYALSNGGFYMAPAAGAFHVTCENSFEGELSAEALGIVACLYAYSHLSFGDQGSLPEACAAQYQLLREHALDHAEARSILAAID